MITVGLDTRTLARTRLAPSPLREAVQWLCMTTGGDRHPYLGRPSAAARAAIADPDVALAAVLVPKRAVGYTPDFLTPKPGTSSDAVSTVRDQLESLETTDPHVVATQVAIRFPRGMPHTVARATESGTLAHRAAAGLARFWRWAVADDWSGLMRIVEQDLAYRTDLAGRQGLGALIGSLHPSLSWMDDTLAIDLPPWQERHALVDVDLVFAPSVLGPARLSVQLHDARHTVVGYPITPYSLQHPARPESGPDLLGRTRSAVLSQLDHPTSTTQLSRRLRVAPATASHHLGILLRAGLVERSRHGHEVLYRLTPQGRRLAEHSTGSAS